MILGIFLLLLHPMTTSSLKSKFFIVMFPMPSLALILGRLMDGVPPVVLKSCASELASFLVNLFRLCLSTSAYPSCWKLVYIQPIPIKADRSYPSNYQSLQLSTRHNLPDNYSIFCNDTQLPLSSPHFLLPHLSFTKNLNRQFHIFTLAKSASKKLRFLWRLC